MRLLRVTLVLGLLASIVACSGAAGPAVTGLGLGVDDSSTNTDADPTVGDPTVGDPTATTVDPTATTADSTAGATNDPTDPTAATWYEDDTVRLHVLAP